MGFCPHWILSPWVFDSLDFVSLGYCPPGLLSPLDFVPLGFCPPWLLSAWILSYGVLSSGILSWYHWLHHWDSLFCFELRLCSTMDFKQKTFHQNDSVYKMVYELKVFWWTRLPELSLQEPKILWQCGLVLLLLAYPYTSVNCILFCFVSMFWLLYCKHSWI